MKRRYFKVKTVSSHILDSELEYEIKHMYESIGEIMRKNTMLLIHSITYTVVHDDYLIITVIAEEEEI